MNYLDLAYKTLMEDLLEFVSQVEILTRKLNENKVNQKNLGKVCNKESFGKNTKEELPSIG
ncbi:MAG: hypothetical protein CVV23_13260 [Ignavibacteriae bacterium HGW-Ignavibacteriae-2]|jgi:hypothetical protein|nr:hypothetical protein [Bacteroidota bacterium]PKL87838.1 MAG: hypothetical protein CVV23_13260 [Ignavibacteriae bacterium HGW-Ignavibacteriae-2]